MLISSYHFLHIHLVVHLKHFVTIPVGCIVHAGERQGHGFSGALRIELVSFHNSVKSPRQLLATVWEHIRYRWIPLATMNTHVIQRAL